MTFVLLNASSLSLYPFFLAVVEYMSVLKNPNRIVARTTKAGIHANSYLGVLLLLGAVWGASFLVIKIGAQRMAPETLVIQRLGIVSVAMMGVALGMAD